MTFDGYEVTLAVGGAMALLAAWLPAYLGRRPLSLPVVLVGVGVVMFLLPVGFPSLDPRDHLSLAERLTELGVIVALMGAGLKIDRPVGWRRWATTWRMLGIAMPLSIAAVAGLGLRPPGPLGRHGGAARGGARPDGSGAGLRRAGGRADARG